MRTENITLMRMAKESLNGKWGLAAGTFFVYFILIACIQIPSSFIPPIGLASLIITGPLVLGIAIFALSISRNQNAELVQLFKGFENFGNSLAAYLLMVVFIFLWMLLLIVPGIIAAISYAMTFFIIADDPSIGPMDAIDKSKKMMYGYKWKYFCLIFRFFGWFLLCLLSLGIGFLWLAPYVQVTIAKFYDDIKDNPISKENV